MLISGSLPGGALAMSVELDVHGLTWAEALAAFKETYGSILAQPAGAGRAVDVIHGYGSTTEGRSVIKQRLHGYLARQGARLEYAPGENLDGNPGHTRVTAVRPLPDDAEELEERILDYCQQPRPLQSIAGEFRRYGAPKVQQAVKALQAQPPLLRKFTKGKRDVYQTV